MLITKLLLQMVPKSSLFCIETLSFVHKSRLFSSLQTNNSIVLCRLIESNVKTLNFVKLFSEDVQPVNGKGKNKRRRVISSDEEDDAVTLKKRFVTFDTSILCYICNCTVSNVNCPKSLSISLKIPRITTR